MTVRGPKREFISRTYNTLLRHTLGARFSDAQCGFKAIRREVAEVLLPLVEDDEWFFDTELLVLAERANLRTHEVPVDWVDDPDSRADIVRTALDDLRGMARVGVGLVRGRIPLTEVRTRVGRAATVSAGGALHAQLLIFAIIGGCSTIGYALLFLLLRGTCGAQWANVIALVATAIANTAANRRFTFGVHGPRRRWRHQLQGLAVFGVGLGATSGALAILHQVAAAPHPIIEMLLLTGANLAVTAMRFAAMRWWIFAHRDSQEVVPGTEGVPTVVRTR